MTGVGQILLLGLAMPNLNQLNYIRRLLYRLKRRYGRSVTFYRTNEAITDTLTGSQIKVVTKFTVKRIVKLPNKKNRTFDYDLSYIAANKNFTYGATYDLNSRQFLVDARDLPDGYIPQPDDRMIENNRRYQIKESVELDEFQGYLIVGDFVEGDEPENEDFTLYLGVSATVGPYLESEIIALPQVLNNVYQVQHMFSPAGVADYLVAAWPQSLGQAIKFVNVATDTEIDVTEFSLSIGGVDHYVYQSDITFALLTTVNIF
jgi:hypothetical protein